MVEGQLVNDHDGEGLVVGSIPFSFRSVHGPGVVV
jgi:hypothetical protein